MIVRARHRIHLRHTWWFVARWHTAYAGLDRQLLQVVMPGGHGDVWTSVKLCWCSFAKAKVSMGSSQLSHLFIH